MEHIELIFSLESELLSSLFVPLELVLENEISSKVTIFISLLKISCFLEWVLMEHIEKICSLESKLFIISICSIRTLSILEVIAKNAQPGNRVLNSINFAYTTKKTKSSQMNSIWRRWKRKLILVSWLPLVMVRGVYYQGQHWSMLTWRDVGSTHFYEIISISRWNCNGTYRYKSKPRL